MSISLSLGGKLVKRIQGSDFVAFSQCRIIEGRRQKIIQSAPKPQDSLTDVNQLRRVGPDDMHLQETSILSMKQHFQKSAVIAHDVATRNLSIAGDTTLIWRMLSFPIPGYFAGHDPDR